MKFVFPVTFPVTFLSQGIQARWALSCKDPPCGLCWIWSYVGFSELQRTFVGPGSEGTIYSRYFECISNMFPVTFPVTFHFRLHNPDISVGSRSVPRSDWSKISYFPRFVGRVRSQGFRGRSRFSSCLETELNIRFPIPTGFVHQVGRVSSQVKPGLDSTGIHYWFYGEVDQSFERDCKCRNFCISLLKLLKNNMCI